MSKLWLPGEPLMPVYNIRNFGEQWARNSPQPFGQKDKAPNSGGGGGGGGGSALGVIATPLVGPPGTTQLDLSWTDTATGETGFKIERSLTGTGGWTQVGTNAANDTTFSDTGLDAETTYYYRVRAYNGSRNGKYSAVFSGTTGAAEFSVAYQTGILMEMYSDQHIYSDAGLTTPATADDAPVAAWNSRSGTKHLIQVGDDTTRPLVKTNQINGLPSVRFDGSNDFLKALFTLGSPFHVFMVVNHISYTNLDYLISSGTGDLWGLIQTPSTPTLRVWNGTTQGGDNNNLAVGTWAIVEVLCDSPASLRVNDTTATTPGSGAGAGDIGGICLGSRAAPSRYANAEYAAVVVYEANIGSTNRDTVVNALATRYGITL